MRDKKEINIPVTILTGFLGAGKTTFLNHLLQKNEGIRYAIIENEFGEQGIDNELVLRPDETIVELNNGCLCCTLNDNLYDILNELFERRSEFDEIIIEATGVADPTGLAQPFIIHPMIRQHFPLRGIICLVDAEQIEDQLQETEEAISQITYSDILLLNKIDLVNERYIAVLERKLKQLNPIATIVKGHKTEFPKIDLNRNHNKLEEELLSAGQIAESNSPETGLFDKKHSAGHHHHKHTEEINSQTFIFNTPFDFKRLHLQLSVYLTFQAKQLYRMKGLIWLENEDQQFVLQSVGKRFDIHEKRAWRKTEKRQSVVVFIGKNLQRKGLERLLKICLSKTRLLTAKDQLLV